MTSSAVERPTKLLNQMIAVRTGLKSDVDQALTKQYHLLQRTQLLNGFTRTYTPRDDEGFRYPGESTEVQYKGEWALKEVGESLTKLFDVTAALDWTNQHARADVILMSGDQPIVLLADVPVTYLMFLEKQLVNLETVIRKLPVLDAAERWTFDPNQDVYRSEPVVTTKTNKIRRNHVKAEATDRHAAQVEVYTEDVPVGTWSTVKFSGMFEASRVNRMLVRVTALIEAVKMARERANMEDIVEVPSPGKAIFGYVFAPDA